MPRIEFFQSDFPVKALADRGYETIMFNYNPETVRADYDECNQPVFDKISFESVLDLYGREQPEGLPLALLEVLAAQTPIVATGVGRVREVVTGSETGRLVEAGIPSALVRALVRDLLDPEPQECFTAADWARTPAGAYFAIEAMVVRCLALYHKGLAR